MLNKAVFYKTVNNLQDLPNESVAEVVFVGRSNAGKSSAINTLTQRKKLAFVSKTPGRTQHINFFSLGNYCYLVDLPGYGYAKVPAEVGDHWRTLLSHYLQTRAQICGMILLMDIRHPLQVLDQQMLAWFQPTGKPIHVLLSKSDKLSQNLAVLSKVEKQLRKYGGNISLQLL